MDEKTAHMVFATAALAAVAAVLAGPAGAYIPEGNGVQPVSGQSASRTLAGPAATQQGLDMAIKTAIASRASQATQLEGVHGALVLNAKQSGSTTPLPHGAQVVLSPPSEAQSLGLTGDSPIGRVVAHEPQGLTGDSALTRVPEAAPASTVSGGGDTDWTSFGTGTGMVALIAAGLVGILLTARRRHTIGLP
jgi:hypothetical protein